jgi:outer membrane biosynthesis protein TonB
LKRSFFMRNTKSLLISAAAAAVIAGGGYSFAQAPSGQAMPETRAPQAAQPAEPKADVKVDTKTQADTKTKADTKVKADTKADTKAKASETKPMKSDTKADSTTKASDTKSDKSSTTTSAPASGKASTTTQSQSTTTGQGAAGTSASLTTEQRTRISTSIRSTNVKPLTNVTFSISVGTKVPRNVSRHRLPVTVIEVYPSWRGYEYILVGNDIIVINPRTLEIVAVISV